MRKRVTSAQKLARELRRIKADTRARRILDLVDRGYSHDEIARVFKVKDVQGLIYQAQRRLQTTVE